MQTAISIEKIRADFPILKRKVRNDKQLVYFDNAATAQKPIQVINAISDFYTNHNSNIHRAVHALAEEATEAYEMTRDKVAKFLNILDRQEIIFVRGTTEAINLVAYTWGRQNVKAGDIIVTTEYEHHSNIVPWQLLTQEKGAKLEYIGVNDDGELLLDQLDTYLATGKVKLVAISQMSNVLGTITDMPAVMQKCKKAGVRVLVDGAQSVPHMKVDLQNLGCDFFAFSAHKMLGPTGVGVLWVRKELLEQMIPFHGGGDMIREVHKYETTWNDLPYKFEAGTPNIADVIGFSAALDYLNNLGMDFVRNHEIEITKYALEKMSAIKGLKIYGTKDISKRGGVISFNFADIHPHDLATIIDEEGVAIRSGHHCAQVLMERLDVAATSRASFYIYNTKEEVDVLIKSLEKAARLFKL
ncbi:cysteine desulfurase [Candidatus Nitrosotenuis chungbukensis]|uniref:cysteine desulfurase n=1 Tax=Candidatus Nitrosotenuis TaxID=1825023 RepID=UPI0005B27B52|nr:MULTISPECIES: cysteine desulfurase [Nitrosotenuis]QLH08499.1 cysteine desulfurase [Candidatus Nitrosotenuis sp. DW1]WKT57097.1 cysteine desulfurase [Candidatus Nitrosotenuis chungbukensis]